MTDTLVLLQLNSLQITAYSLALTLAAAAAILLTMLLARRKSFPIDVLPLCAATVLGALIGGRLVYVLTCFDHLAADYGPEYLWMAWRGGYTLYGALGGGALAATLWLKAMKAPVAEGLNLLAPGAALAIAVGRAAEYFTNQGLGKDLIDLTENEAFWFFPIGVQIDEGFWQVPVFMYEALFALAALVVTLLALKKNRGRGFEKLIVIVGMTQIICDSLRSDDFIRFGFVHFNQLCAAVSGLAVIIVSVLRCRNLRGAARWDIIRVAMYLLGVGIVVAIEFALDKSAVNNLLLWSIMALTLVMMGTACLTEKAQAANKEERSGVVK